MNYESSQVLSDNYFKRLVGMKRSTFEEMVKIIREAYQTKYSKGCRKSKITLEGI